MSLRHYLSVCAIIAQEDFFDKFFTISKMSGRAWHPEGTRPAAGYPLGAKPSPFPLRPLVDPQLLQALLQGVDLLVDILDLEDDILRRFEAHLGALLLQQVAPPLMR